jgi:DNA-binding MarR family transcriptional regulator
VQSVVSEQDARSIDLSLTESGLALFRKVLPHAIARNQELLNVLSADEQRQLFNALQKLTLHAKEIWDHERQLKI